MKWNEKENEHDFQTTYIIVTYRTYDLLQEGTKCIE